MDKALLEELQHIIETNGDGITQKSTNRLLLASMVSVVTALNDMRCKIDTLTETIGDQGTTVTNQEEECLDRFATKDDLRKVENNLAIRAGHFVAERPKIAFIIFVILGILANTWFISDFRQWVLFALGVPINLLQVP